MITDQDVIDVMTKARAKVFDISEEEAREQLMPRMDKKALAHLKKELTIITQRDDNRGLLEKI